MSDGQPVVVGFGQCSWDLLGRVPSYPAVDEKVELQTLLEQGGGPVATALVTLARLGVAGTFLGTVGGDRYGQLILAELQAEGVDCHRVQVDPRGTSQLAFVAVEATTGHRNIFWKRGENRPFSFSEADLQQIGQARFLHLDGLDTTGALVAARHARDQGVCTVLDGGTLRAGTIDLLPFIDHLVVSRRFAEAFGGSDLSQAGMRLLGYGASAVTITCGAAGSYSLMSGGESFHQPAFSVAAVDTTGCGDVFHGGYLYGLVRGWPLRHTVKFAAACAALKTRRLGGRTAIAGLQDVTGFLVQAE